VTGENTHPACSPVGCGLPHQNRSTRMLGRDSHLVPTRAGILSRATREIRESRRRGKRFPRMGVRESRCTSGLAPASDERDLPAGRQVNRLETEILTSLKQPEVRDGPAGDVDSSRSPTPRFGQADPRPGQLGERDLRTPGMIKLIRVAVCDLPDGRGGGAAWAVRDDPGADPLVRRAATAGGRRMTPTPDDPCRSRRGGTVGAARKRGGSPSLGVNAVGFKRSTATKDAFQRN